MWVTWVTAERSQLGFKSSSMNTKKKEKKKQFVCGIEAIVQWSRFVHIIKHVDGHIG